MFKKYIAYVVFTSLQLEGQNILKQQSRINVEKRTVGDNRSKLNKS